MKKGELVVLSGAGMSAESGLKTFRDNNGLWEQHRVEDVATPEAWHRDRTMVLRFYNQRRVQLGEAKPNSGHQLLAALEQDWDVTIVTQNVDDLHERGGSSRVMHLHGQLTQVRSSIDEHEVRDIGYRELKEGELCTQGEQLRPNIVWFGEAVPMIDKAAKVVSQAGVLIIVGTSLNVYPAAGLINYAATDCPIYVIDPDPSMLNMASERINVINEKATTGLAIVAQILSDM